MKGYHALNEVIKLDEEEKKIKASEIKLGDPRKVISQQYECTKCCRRCPFPGLKCVENTKKLK
ncbi:hypothetical protein Psfp_00165 [Pelotomaculum sp. FP]|uniref:hypothetical protein n=1 Tax=Pelotomaculum sp. FP TaxID=261474 RepID=UPI001066AAF2|nr:hypothetical protein [Pelotomaculum sp. FP]TEB18041.1 hypothetical protein Psfp_00165 [Pelotomaculum sp. FP]